jgi:MFS family permease
MLRGLLKGYAVLGRRNYRLFWMGQWASLVGTWMQTAAQGWLLLRLSGNPFVLGLLGSVSAAPMLLLVLVGGVVSDRANRQRVILITQALSLLQGLLLAWLTLTGRVQTWHILALAGTLGAINAFDIPARQAFVVDLVGRRELPNAIALNATGFNVARVVGPAIGGFVVAAVGEGICFLVNAISYLFVLWGLWLIEAAPLASPVPGAAPDIEPTIAAGLRYTWRHAELLLIVTVVGVVSAFGVPYRVLLPDMAQTVLGVDAWWYGVLMAAAGVGAGIAAVVLAGLQLSAEQYRRLLPAGLALFCLSLIGFGLARNYWLSALALVVVGAGGIIYFNASHVLVQLGVEDEYRGRVMAAYTLMHQGTATIGSLALGYVAARSGTPTALVAGALACFGALLWLAFQQARGV